MLMQVCDILQQPITIELGTSGYKYQGSGVKRRLVEQKDEFQYVPLIENLQSVLQNRNIYHEVSCSCTYTHVCPFVVMLFLHYCSVMYYVCTNLTYVL